MIDPKIQEELLEVAADVRAREAHQAHWKSRIQQDVGALAEYEAGTEERKAQFRRLLEAVQAGGEKGAGPKSESNGAASDTATTEVYSRSRTTTKPKSLKVKILEELRRHYPRPLTAGEIAEGTGEQHRSIGAWLSKMADPDYSPRVVKKATDRFGKPRRGLYLWGYDERFISPDEASDGRRVGVSGFGLAHSEHDEVNGGLNGINGKEAERVLIAIAKRGEGGMPIAQVAQLLGQDETGALAWLSELATVYAAHSEVGIPFGWWVDDDFTNLRVYTTMQPH